MYEQQLKYLPTSSMENLFDCIKDKIQPEKVAVVLHDKDINKDGNPVEGDRTGHPSGNDRENGGWAGLYRVSVHSGAGTGTAGAGPVEL